MPRALSIRTSTSPMPVYWLPPYAKGCSARTSAAAREAVARSNDTIRRDVVLSNKVLHTKHQASHTLPARATAWFKSQTVCNASARRIAWYHYESPWANCATRTGGLPLHRLALLNDPLLMQTPQALLRTEVAAQYDAFLSGYGVLNADTGELHDPWEDYKTH